jgi:hypothetical protein
MPGMRHRRMIPITLAGAAVIASLVLTVWRDKGAGTGKTGIVPRQDGTTEYPCDSGGERRGDRGRGGRAVRWFCA